MGGLLPRPPPEGLPVVLGALAGRPPPPLPLLPPLPRILGVWVMSIASLKRAGFATKVPWFSCSLDRQSYVNGLRTQNGLIKAAGLLQRPERRSQSLRLSNRSLSPTSVAGYLCRGMGLERQGPVLLRESSLSDREGRWNSIWSSRFLERESQHSAGAYGRLGSGLESALARQQRMLPNA